MIEATSELTAGAAAQRVRECLQNYSLPGVTLCVHEEDVHLRNGYWRVPVRPSIQPSNISAFYELLADVEGELQDDAGLNITLTTAEP